MFFAYFLECVKRFLISPCIVIIIRDVDYAYRCVIGGGHQDLLSGWVHGRDKKSRFHLSLERFVEGSISGIEQFSRKR